MSGKNNRTAIKEWDIVIVDRSSRVRRKDSKYAFQKGVVRKEIIDGKEVMSGIDEGNWKFDLYEVSDVIGNAKKKPELLDCFIAKDILLKEMRKSEKKGGD